jgi:hypothetical protein
MGLLGSPVVRTDLGCEFVAGVLAAQMRRRGREHRRNLNPMDPIHSIHKQRLGLDKRAILGLQVGWKDCAFRAMTAAIRER